jgi:hypothetical protein
MPSFKVVIDDFKLTMDALRDFVASVGPVLTERVEQTASDASTTVGRFQTALILAGEDLDSSDVPDKVKQILSRVRTIITGADPTVSAEKVSALRDTIRQVIPIKIVADKVEVDTDDPAAPELISQTKVIQKLKKEIGLLRESALMALSSRSEWFIAQLMHLFFHKHPEAAGMSEPFFSLDTLASLQTIDDARNVLIDHKVESVMRQSFEDWLTFFKDKPKLGLGYLDAEKGRLAEIFKRRNVIVHNGGRISRKYFLEVDESLRPGLQLGDVVEVTPDYLNAAIDLIEHQFILIAAELWKKLEPSDQSRGSLLTGLAVECLNERRWLAARGFSYFAMNDKNQVEATRLYAQVNYWQSFKWAGQYDQIRAEVEGLDFSAKSALYQLAHAALTDNFKSFYELLPKILASGELTRNQLASWPLFQAMRERPEFVDYRPDEKSPITLPERKLEGNTLPSQDSPDPGLVN